MTRRTASLHQRLVSRPPAEARIAGRRLLQSRRLYAAAVSAALPLVSYFLLTRYYRVPVSRAMFVVDFVLLGYLSWLFALFQTNNRLAIAPFAIVAGLISWAAVWKFVIIGLWVRLADITTLDEGWQALSLTQQALVAGAIVCAGALALWNFRIPSLRGLCVSLTPLVVCGGVMFLYPDVAVRFLLATTHARYGNDPLYRSPWFAIGFDALRTLQFQQARILLAGHAPRSVSAFSTEPRRRRNVHIFVMESLMDPALLGLALPDPLDPGMRRDLGGSSFSPVFGGQSSQAEFELLCGIPAYDLLDPVTFNELGGQPVDCLPAFLRRYGYITMASSPASPNFFNAREAYRSLGFSVSHFRGDFPTTDLDGPWISADATIAVNKEHIRPLLESGTPFLNYVFFSSGHLPYEMNPITRPLVIPTSSTDEVTHYVNALYYNTSSVARYLNYLAAVDPDAVVVVVGDHQGAVPSIGRTRSAAHATSRYQTPYVFRDAREVKRHGDLAHYEVPLLVVSSLSETAYERVARPYGVDVIRPLPGRAFYQDGEEVHDCPESSDARCTGVGRFQSDTIAAWLQIIEQSKAGGGGGRWYSWYVSLTGGADSYQKYHRP